MSGNVYREVDGYPQFRCTFAGFDSGALEIERRKGQSEAGTAVFGSHTRKVRPVTRSLLGSTNFDGLYGYEIVDGDTVVSAIETINRGRVWIEPSSTQNEARLAALATALLLYRPREVDPDQDCK